VLAKPFSTRELTAARPFSPKSVQDIHSDMKKEDVQKCSVAVCFSDTLFFCKKQENDSPFGIISMANNQKEKDWIQKVDSAIFEPAS
jgi:hypothetical protein